MKQILYCIQILTLSITASIGCNAQTLEEYFVTGLKSQIQLNQDTRKALLNGYKSGQGSTLQLQNGGSASVLEYAENNYIKIQTSKEGFFSLKRWEIGKDVMFGLSWWVCNNHCDGAIKIVRPNSLQQDTKFSDVSLKDFFNVDSLEKSQMTADEFLQKFEIDFLHHEFTSNDTIWVINNTAEYLDEERQRLYSKYWKGNALPVIQKDGTFIKGEITNKVIDHKK